ncbi:cytochrome P450 4c3-like protein, partial [Dinothrombium tinctorium]
GKRSQELVKELHAFTRKVIEDRKKELLKSDNADGERKSLTFLDLLLHQHLKDQSISLEEIREEVDTFAFAGHDTT